MSNMPRMSISLPTPESEKLKNEAVLAEASQSEIIRRAIVCYTFMAEEARAGRRLRSENADGTDSRDIVILGL